MMLFKKLLREVKEFLKGMGKALHEQSVEVLELEAIELEHAFLSIIMGSLVGIPLMPLGLALEVTPLIEEELKLLLDRTWRGGDTIADFFSRIGGEW